MSERGFCTNCPLRRAVWIERVDEIFRGNIDGPIRADGDAFVSGAAHEPFQSAIRRERVEVIKHINGVDGPIGSDRRPHKRVRAIHAEAPVHVVRRRRSRRDGQRSGVTAAGAIDHLHRERRQRRTLRHVGDNACAGPSRHRRADPAHEHSAVAAKVASENLEKTTSRQGRFGQTGDDARAGHRPVKSERPRPH